MTLVLCFSALFCTQAELFRLDLLDAVAELGASERDALLHGSGTPDGMPDGDAAVESRAGKLLVATNRVTDPAFADSVVYVLADDEAGTAGVILNRPLALDANAAAAWLHALELHDGGPVGRERAIVLHDQPLPGSLALAPDLYVSTDGALVHALVERALVSAAAPARDPFSFDDAARVAHDAAADALIAAAGNTRVFFGYAGWAPGQLDDEIAAGAWGTAGARPAVVFLDPALLP